MAELSITTATASDLTGRVTAYSISSKDIDGATDQDETEYTNSNWSQQWGYFNNVPDLKSAIIMKAIWNVGKGYTADPETMIILDHISGWGKDTFDDILFNMEIIKRIGGDSFAEIIRGDNKEKTLINLKPLDPSSIKIIVDKKGIIKRYEQISKTKGALKKFQPDEILHFSNNRLADQIHGISDIDAVEKTILADEENFDNLKKIMHRQAKPMIMFKLGTDNQTIINAFITKMDAATNKGENIYIPDDKNAVSWEIVQVNVSEMVLAWRNELRNRFYRTIGLPQVIFGQANTTESGGKIEYLAHEQIFEKEQRFIELQIWNQLNLKINLLPPTSLLENLQTDEHKDMSETGMPQGMEFQQGDITAGVAK